MNLHIALLLYYRYLKIDIKKHEQYIKSMLLEIFEKYYEKASSILASNIRKAICRVDEVLFLNE